MVKLLPKLWIQIEITWTVRLDKLVVINWLIAGENEILSLLSQKKSNMSLFQNYIYFDTWSSNDWFI